LKVAAITRPSSAPVSAVSCFRSQRIVADEHLQIARILKST
jgi:hypothetical protein